MVRSNQQLSKAVKTLPSKKPLVASVKPEKKPHRWRNGTVALRQIRKQQKSTKHILQKLPFRRLVREITQDHKPDLKITGLTFEVLQEISEAYMIHLFTQAQLAAIQAKRIGITDTDIDYVKTQCQFGYPK